MTIEELAEIVATKARGYHEALLEKADSEAFTLIPPILIAVIIVLLTTFASYLYGRKNIVGELHQMPIHQLLPRLDGEYRRLFRELDSPEISESRYTSIDVVDDEEGDERTVTIKVPLALEKNLVKLQTHMERDGARRESAQHVGRAEGLPAYEPLPAYKRPRYEPDNLLQAIVFRDGKA